MRTPHTFILPINVLNPNCSASHWNYGMSPTKFCPWGAYILDSKLRLDKQAKQDLARAVKT